MTALEKFDRALQAVCPIDGVSVGSWSDRSTWRIDFRAEATTAERAAAQAVKDSFDPTVTADEQAGAAVSAIDRLQFEVMFDMENRMRAREGLPPVLKPAYRNALVNRWKALNP